MYVLKEDPELKVELYTCSPEQTELLGLDQMNADCLCTNNELAITRFSVYFIYGLAKP